ncbi:MAG: hypothetical protein ABFD44_03635, partial [Anaerolineaceae bacterium]
MSLKDTWHRLNRVVITSLRLALILFLCISSFYWFPTYRAQASNAFQAGPFTISGNAGVAGTTLSYNDGSPQTVTADSSGNYSVTVPEGWTGIITPSLAGYEFAPSSREYTTPVVGNLTGEDYTATAILLTISGNTGEPGVTLSYVVDSAPQTATADGLGDYSFKVPYNWSGTVTPSLAGYTFSPTDRTYTNITLDQPNENYVAAIVTYTFSGTAGVAGATLSYEINSSPLTATADGSGLYSFAIPYDWKGTVTPSKTGYTFSPTSLSYSNVKSDQIDQNYIASIITHTISGTAGVAGATLSYSVGGTPLTAIADGSGLYSFAVP